MPNRKSGTWNRSDCTEYGYRWSGASIGGRRSPPAVAEKRLSLAWSRTMRSKKRFAL
ncbi:uncharacterized protein METZ01_LOCUS270082, partial [marine metagenome]